MSPRFGSLVLGLSLAAPSSYTCAQRPAGDRSTNPGAGKAFVTVELATVGIDLRTQGAVVLLREAELGLVVPIAVGMEEARAIARALHGAELPRPMTHDLLANMVEELGGQVDEVLVHDLRENTYIGLIRVRTSDTTATHEIDSRPSDALALAVRTGATIRVWDQILLDAPDIDFVAPEGEEQIVHTLGITVVAPTAELRREFELPPRDGVFVRDVAGPAARAGLRPGDLILEVNGLVPHEPMDFFEAVRGFSHAGVVSLIYWRDGRERQLEFSPGLPDTGPRPRQTDPIRT